MEKKNYIVPAITVNEFDAEAYLLSVSSTESLEGTKFGGDAKEGGMEADSKDRNSWDEGLW
jgi:hypothetical protein